jgi:hypothetical protein
VADQPLSKEERAQKAAEAKARDRAERKRFHMLFSVYRGLAPQEQERIDTLARDDGYDEARRAGFVIDGPEFGPPWGQFWSEAARHRERAWDRIMTKEHGRELSMVVQTEDEGRWLPERRPLRTSGVSVADAVARLGAMPAGLESRPRKEDFPRSSEEAHETDDGWAGRE